jgi:anti-sigma factor RsiW
MRCRDAREWLGVQRDGDLDPSEAQALAEHLQGCSACRAFEQHLQQINLALHVPTPRAQPNVSTERIMLAIQQRKRITQQLEDIHQQQQTRLERLRPIGAVCTALGIFTLSSIPLLLLAMAIIETDLAVKVLYWLNGVIDLFIILAQYIQAEQAMIERNTWLLSAMAFAFVIMTGMWLRLMRHPQEA